MKKRISLFIFIITLGIVLVGCTKTEEITLSVEKTDIVLQLGISEQIKHTTNDEEGVTFKSGDATIASVTETGLIKSLKVGSTKITVTSKTDETKSVTVNVKVEDSHTEADGLLLNSGSVEGDIIEIGSTKYVFGRTLFNSLSDLSDIYPDGASISVQPGTYKGDANISGNYVIKGEKGAIFDFNIIGEATILNISGITFKGSSSITLNSESELIFNDNTVNTVNQDFIKLVNNNNVQINNNIFDDIQGSAISFVDINKSINVLIEKNEFKNVSTAVTINQEIKFDKDNKIHIYRNKINNADLAFDISLGSSNATGAYQAYARFNEVVEYDKAVKVDEFSKFEFTLNYWGVAELDMSKFEKVNKTYVLGHYKNVSEIISEKDYDPKTPLMMIVDEVIDVIELGTNFRITHTIVPLSASQNVRFIVDKVGLIQVAPTGFVTPLTSGEVVLEMYPSTNRAIGQKLDITVTTEPGIHLTPEITRNNLLVGDVFNLVATPFPYNYVDKAVRFESLNPTIASVDSNGKVTILNEGLFRIRAFIEEEDSYFETITFEGYNDLDGENSLADFVTERQMSYAQINDIYVYGAGFDFSSYHSDSVSRLLFGEVERNLSKMIGLDPKVRPGTKKNSNIDDKYKFNPENIVWVVIHETANTSPGSGANSHANYLLNQVANGTGNYTSWHATVDSKELYQHIPFDEVAWHAGDGSTLPGNGMTLPGGAKGFGGGNRNGIGVEMGVNQDGNIMKTWQRAAKFAAELMYTYNLPITQLSFHNDFSGKECPQSMRRGGYVDLFKEFVQNEFDYLHKYNGSTVKITSNNPDILDDNGVFIKTPNESITVSYDVEVTINNVTTVKTYYTYVPGLWK